MIGKLLTVFFLGVLAVAGFVASVNFTPTRNFYRSVYYYVLAYKDAYKIIRNEMIAVDDDVRLATDIYLPRSKPGPFPALLVRLPYNKQTYGGALLWARRYAAQGYVVIIQDMRGRFGSEGEFAIFPNEASDGSRTLDWIIAQPWSNGRVASVGCSALGETQAILATARHPAHRAMIAEAAGGAVGTASRSRAYFGFYEGGVPQLAGALGWFLGSGGKSADAMKAPDVAPADIIAELPSGLLVSRYRDDPTDYDALFARFEDRAYWDAMGFLKAEDQFSTPSLHVNSWSDPALTGTFEIAKLMRANAADPSARDNQPVLIGPGEHCNMAWAFQSGKVGDLAIDPDAALDYFSVYDRWLDHWLRDGPAPALPAFTYFVLGANRWETAPTWPPPGVVERRWNLGADGSLADGPATAGSIVWRYDPMDPTPSLGGPDCCTGQPNLRSGPVDQRPNASRADVVGFASEALSHPIEIIGDIWLEVYVSSSAPDTDIVAILLDIAPDGTMLPIQHGALRLRYRDSFDAPQLLQQGEIVKASVSLRQIAYMAPEGHRLGLHISSSSFPRLERNLNTGRANHLETEPVIASNVLHFGAQTPSALILPVRMAPSSTGDARNDLSGQ